MACGIFFFFAAYFCLSIVCRQTPITSSPPPPISVNAGQSEWAVALRCAARTTKRVCGEGQGTDYLTASEDFELCTHLSSSLRRSNSDSALFIAC